MLPQLLFLVLLVEVVLSFYHVDLICIVFRKNLGFHNITKLPNGDHIFSNPILDILSHILFPTQASYGDSVTFKHEEQSPNWLY